MEDSGSFDPRSNRGGVTFWPVCRRYTGFYIFLMPMLKK